MSCVDHLLVSLTSLKNKKEGRRESSAGSSVPEEVSGLSNGTFTLVSPTGRASQGGGKLTLGRDTAHSGHFTFSSHHIQDTDFSPRRVTEDVSETRRRTTPEQSSRGVQQKSGPSLANTTNGTRYKTHVNRRGTKCLLGPSVSTLPLWRAYPIPTILTKHESSKPLPTHCQHWV